MDIRIGCSGWTYPVWKGKFYPESIPQKKFFEYYSAVFNTVEVNTTFYQHPTQNTVQLWYDQAPLDFKYTIKAHQIITHFKKFKHCEKHIKNLYAISDILKEKLGSFLFQIPSNYPYNKENLAQILDSLDPQYPNVVEFRNESWWKPEVVKAFRRKKIVFSAVSGFDLPEIVYSINNIIHVKFYGDSAHCHNYSSKDMLSWANKIIQNQPKTVWIYFNNDVEAKAPKMVMELLRLVQEGRRREFQRIKEMENENSKSSMGEELEHNTTSRIASEDTNDTVDVSEIHESKIEISSHEEIDDDHLYVFEPLVAKKRRFV